MRTQEGPCSPGGLGTETNMSIMRISTAPSQAFSLIRTWVLFPFPQWPWASPLAFWNSCFASVT